jgi:hypothetical protein
VTDTGSPGRTSFEDQATTVACNCSAAAAGTAMPATSATPKTSKPSLLISIVSTNVRDLLHRTACIRSVRYAAIHRIEYDGG